MSHWQHRALSLSASDPAGSDIGAIVTMTECESNIESESECESNIEPRPPAAATGFGRRLLAGAGLKIPQRIEGQTMQGFLSCSALEGRPIAAFIFGWYIQHNPCFIHVAKLALFNRVFSFVVQKQIAPHDRS